MDKPKTKNAFVIIHFGSNPKYLELELYFCIMLQKFTTNNIIYMYSQMDTPASFAEAISPYVYNTIAFNDDGLTYNVNFESNYSSFNTLRTCDFIFAYTLTDYEKICIIESDLVIMNNIDSIFSLNNPAIVCYRCGESELNQNLQYTTTKEDVLSRCVDSSGLNGGVILIQPSDQLFNEYQNAIPIIAKTGCKYPNEALFEYVNNTFYNLPVKYNLSHYHTLRLKKYGMRSDGRDVLIYHFNETEFKHIDIIKDNWLKDNASNPDVQKKYVVKRKPIEFFEKTIYEPYKNEVNAIIQNLSTKTKAKATNTNANTNISKKNPWIQEYSSKYNTKYWCNTNTLQSSWEKPSELSGEARIAIIIPFRDLEPGQVRTQQLQQFVAYMSTYLNGHDYNIFVVEQTNDGRKFNRGQLLNIGFKYALKQGYDNFIFHDVDLLPSEELKKYYTTIPTNEPVHIAAVWDRYNGNPNYFGGIVAFNENMYKKINGYPNDFWGWGGEDDELQKRTAPFYKIFKVKEGSIRDLENMSLQQKLEYLDENQLKFMQKREALARHNATWQTNGLNSLSYREVEIIPCGEQCERIVVELAQVGGRRRTRRRRRYKSKKRYNSNKKSLTKKTRRVRRVLS